MQHAKNLTLEVHRRAARILTPGISTKEVRRFIDDAHRALGTSGNTLPRSLAPTAPACVGVLLSEYPSPAQGIGNGGKSTIDRHTAGATRIRVLYTQCDRGRSSAEHA